MFLKIACAISNFFHEKLHLSNAKILRYYNEWVCMKTIANLVLVASNCLGIVIFYTEILTGKVVLWCFFMSEISEKIPNATFLVRISV